MSRTATAILIAALVATASCSDDGGSSSVTDSGSSSAGDTSGEPSGLCPPNRVGDPSFEGGSPNAAWTEQSFLYEGVICDADCAMNDAAVPRTGDFAIWFGGIAQAELATVHQEITLPQGVGRLTFWLGIDTGPQRNGDDRLTVRLGGAEVFTVTEAQTDDYPAYTQIDIPLQLPAGAQLLEFEADLSGNHVTSFFVDDVSITVCPDAVQPEPTTGGDTTTAGPSDTDTSTGTGETSDTSGTGGGDTTSDTDATTSDATGTDTDETTDTSGTTG